ncbi:MAG: response regulator [Anaerolineae bacterium]
MSTRRRILVVDDDERVLFVLQETLATLGDDYEVLTAQNGRSALGRIKETAFDLVITDLRMPDIHGVELTEAIRAMSPTTTVIWITAYDCRTLTADAVRLEVFRCLDKPLEIDEIRDAVREALGEVTNKPSADSRVEGDSGKPTA